MKIECGKYILLTDSLENMWIKEKYMGETKDGQPKESTRRVSGYLTKIDSLAHDFLNKGLYGADVDNMNDLLAKMVELQRDIDEICKKYKEEKSK
jgi:hypothetical protein